MRRWVAGLVAAAAVAAAGQALAQPREPTKAERAQNLFDVGMKLMDARDFAHACPLLEQSEQLDPGMGTRFRIAECYEGTGRLASAWALFTAVAEEAKWAQTPDREKVARQRAAALEPRLSKLAINVPARLGTLVGLDVRLDGKPVPREHWGAPRPADPGEHRIEIKATGRKPWEGAAKVDRPGTSVAVDAPEDLEAAPAEIAPAPGPSPEPAPAEPEGPRFWTTQRIAAAGAAGVGAIGLVLGTGFGISAASKWSDAESRCEGGDHDRCSASAVSLGDEASSAATVSTIGFLLGVAGVGAGAYLWFTAPSEPAEPSPAQPARGAPAPAWQLAPAVGPGVAGGVLRGRF